MNRDAPTVVRRRKIARAHREQTPEPELKRFDNKIRYSDEERSSSPTSSTKAVTRRESSESTISSSRATTPRVTSVSGNDGNDDAVPLRSSARSHMNKILNRRDKILLSRSHSSPREDNPTKTDTNINSDLHKLMRTARRSLSSPRNKEESSDNSGRISPANLRKGDKPKIPPRKIFPMQQVEANNQNNKTELTKLERNLKRFEEERLRFEQEKQNFEKEKHELEKLQIKRFNDIERRRFNISNKKNSNKLILLPISDDSLKKTQRSVSPKRKPLILDYESSTVSCSSSEEADDDLTSSPVDDDITMKKNIEKEIVMTNGNTSNIIEANLEEKEIKLENTPQENNTEPSHTKDTTDNSLIVETNIKQNLSRKSLMKILLFDSYRCWRDFKNENYDKYHEICLLRNRCFTDFILLTIFCGMGGIIFRFTEGAFENFYKCGVKRVKRDFIDQLWYSSHNLREDDWKELARKRLRIFEEELHVAHEAGITSYSGMKSWSFLNGVIYCITVVTTIGYGHISPATTTGQAITIVYAIFGIPIFLILLADFGKLFTRAIKFLWAYVRRLYYTGSCRKVRKSTQKDMMRGINMMYDIATFRRPSMMHEDDVEQNGANVVGLPKQENLSTTSNSPSRHVPVQQPQTPISINSIHLAPPIVRNSMCDSPTTPVADIEIDDEFNLPISLAIFILVTYIFIGATVYSMWEDWSYFESFYFVFISMSTIGFGDYVPQHPMYMMASIVYLVFGLALTSMCINVVQLKLSDSFRQASAKIGATIGLLMAEEEAAARNSLQQSPVDLASVHSGGNNNNNESPPIPPRAPTNDTKTKNGTNTDKTKVDKKKKNKK